VTLSFVPFVPFYLLLVDTAICSTFVFGLLPGITGIAVSSFAISLLNALDFNYVT
jgi:hypothetical protein